MSTNARNGKSARNNATQTGSPAVAAAENSTFGTEKHPEGFLETWRHETHWWRGRAVLCLFLSLLLVTMQPFGNGLYSAWGNDSMAGFAVAADGSDEVTPQAEPAAPAEEPQPAPQEEPAQPQAPAPAEDAPQAPAPEVNDQPAATGSDSNATDNGEAADANNAADVNAGGATEATDESENAAKDEKDADSKDENEADATKDDKDKGKDAEPAEKNYGWLMLQADPDTGQASAGAAILRDPATGANATAVKNGTSATAAAPFAPGFSADGVSWKVWKLSSPNYAGQATNVTTSNATLVQGAPTPEKAATAAGTADAWDKGSKFYNDAMAKDGAMYIGISPAFVVTYDANGGEGYLDPVVYDATVDTAAMRIVANVSSYSGAGFTREGYHLVGWALEPEGETVVPLNADASAIADALNHAAAGSFNAEGQLTGNATLYAAWEEGSSEETFEYTYTLVRDAALADNVVVTVFGLEITDEGTEVTITSQVELTYEDALRQINAATETVVVQDEEADEAVADAVSAAASEFTDANLREIGLLSVASADAAALESEGASGPAAAATKGVPTAATTTDEDASESVGTASEDVEWEITEPAGVGLKSKLKSAGVVFTAGAAELKSAASEGWPPTGSSAKVIYYESYKDAPVRTWTNSQVESASPPRYYDIHTEDNLYALGAAGATYGNAANPLIDPSAANGMMGAVYWIDSDGSSEGWGYSEDWDPNASPTVHVWKLGYKLINYMVVNGKSLANPVKKNTVYIADDNTHESTNEYYSGYFIDNMASITPYTTTNDQYDSRGNNTGEGTKFSNTQMGSVTTRSDDGTFFYYIPAFATWQINKYKVYMKAGNTNLIGANASLTKNGIAWNEGGFLDAIQTTGSNAKNAAYKLDKVKWDVYGCVSGTIKGTAVVKGASIAANTTLGQIINPDNLSIPDVDPFSRTSGYMKNGGTAGTVLLIPVYPITYHASDGSGKTVVETYSVQASSADFVVASLSGAEKLLSSGETGFGEEGFLGWSFTESGTQDNIVLQPSDCGATWTSLVNDGKVDSAYMSTVSSSGRTAYVLQQPLDLYAVWESANTHTVTWQLVDEGGATVSDAVLSGTNEEYSENKKFSEITSDVTAVVATGGDLDLFNAKYVGDGAAAPVIEWQYSTDNGATWSAIGEDTLTADGTILKGTLKLARYDVTVDVADGHFVYSNDGTDYDIKQVVVTGVPYGTSYSNITFDLANESTELGNTASGTNDKLTVAYDKTAVAGTGSGASIESLANNGIGLGEYVNYNGTASASGAWNGQGAWTNPESATAVELVNGSVATALTYTYNKGYNKVTFAVASAASNATAGADATVQATQATTDIALTSPVSTANATTGLAESVAYVPYDEWTTYGNVAKASNWYAGSDTALGAYPAVTLASGVTDHALADKYADSGALAWTYLPTGKTDNDTVSGSELTFTGTPTLRTFDVTLTVNYDSTSTVGSPEDNRGYITRTKDGTAVSGNSTTYVVGTATYGNYGNEAINATVVAPNNEDDGVVASNKDGYTAKGATWVTNADSTDEGNDPDTTQVTSEHTFYMNMAKKTYNLQVTVDCGVGGSFNDDTPTSGQTSFKFTINDVPYNTALNNVKYKKSGSTYTYAPDGDGTYSLNAPDNKKTAGTGRQIAGTWDKEDAVLHDNLSRTYDFGRDNVTVKFVIDDGGGTWGTGKTDTVTGYVPYGKTLADMVTTAGGSTALGIPDVSDIVVASGKTWQYVTPSTSAGSWSTTPGTPTTTTEISPTSSSDVVTFTYTLATRSNLKVEYKIPDTSASEVAFGDGGTNKTTTNLSYGAVTTSVAPPPTTLVKASSPTLTDDEFSAKYNTTISASDWNNQTDSTSGIASTVTKDTTYEAIIANLLKNYSVSYEIVNGSWGSSTTANDATTYHYGDKPSTSYNVAQLSATGNTSESKVTPNSGYGKTDPSGDWAGVWEVSINDGAYMALTDAPKATAGASTPSEVPVTGNMKFRLTLKKVVSVTFASDTNSINSGGPSSGPTEYFVGDTMAVPSVTDANITANNNTVNHTKSDSYTEKQRGHWDPALPSGNVVPDSDTAALTYTYTLYPVHTVKYDVVHGTWSGTWHDNAISGSDELQEEVFENESITVPGSAHTKAAYSEAPDYYKGTVASGTKLDAKPSGTVTDDKAYTVNYPSAGKLTYSVEFYTENIDSAKMSAADKTALTADQQKANYTNYYTWTSEQLDAGTKIGISAAIMSDSASHLSNAAGFQVNDTLSDARVELEANFTAELDESGIVYKVYYDRKSFTLTYTYAYPDGDEELFTKSELPSLPNSGAAYTIPFEDSVTLDSTVATTSHYIFGGWNANPALSDGKMPADNVTVTGNWTRKPITITLKNNETSKGNITKDGSNSNTVTISRSPDDSRDLKYGDSLDWGDSGYKVSVVEGTNQYFAGWEDSNNSNKNIGRELPTKVEDTGDDANTHMKVVDAGSNKLKAEYTVSWSDQVRVEYKRGIAGTFIEQDSGMRNPPYEIPAFDLDKNGDPATLHENGYIFMGWSKDGGSTVIADTASGSGKTKPETGDATGYIVYTAKYEGTPHQTTYNLNGATQTTSDTRALKEGTKALRTGDEVYLPGKNETSKTGCTLTGYSVQIGNDSPQTVPLGEGGTGVTYTIPAGSAGEGSTYTDAISITALYTTTIEFKSNITAAPGLTLKDTITTALSTGNSTYGTTALGASVTLPAVWNANDQDGYHFTGWADNVSPSLNLANDATSFTVPDTVPAEGIELTASWAIDKYTVNWEYPSDGHSDYDYTSEASILVQHATAGSAIATPQLKGSGAGGTLDTAKYTAANVDWLLKVGDDLTEINIDDIEFGTDFWVGTDGKKYNIDPGNGATKIAFSDSDDAHTQTSLTFVGVPVINKHTITLQVSNGTMTNPGTSAKGQTSVSYTKEFGTPFAGTGGFLSALNDYAFTADESHVQSSGRWGTAGNPLTGGLTVTGAATYTYEFPTTKTYRVVYQIDTAYTDDSGKIKLTSDGTIATWGTTYTTSSFPTLTYDSSMTAGQFDAKYHTALTWKRAAATPEDIASGTTYTYNDDQVTADTGDYPNGKVITFYGTPQTKSYTVRVGVKGGAFKNSVDGVDATTNKKTISTDAVYGKTLIGTDYLTSAVEGYFEFNSANNMPTGHWEYDDGTWVTNTSTVGVDSKGANATDVTYYYVFDTRRTVTFHVENGQFASGPDTTTDRVYYIADDGLTDGTTHATFANATTTDDVTTRAFSSETAAQVVFELVANDANNGYTWNDTGWTSTGGSSTLTTGSVGGTDSVNVPDINAGIHSDVTFTYSYAPKPVQVKFVQRFQSANDGDTYEAIKVTEGTGEDATEVKRYITWNGAYNATDVTLADWAGRVLGSTDNLLGAEGNSYVTGFKAVPVKLTASDSFNDTALTAFDRTQFSGTKVYYLWYDRISVNYFYSYTNASDAPKNGGSSPIGVPSQGEARYGQTVQLAEPLDTTFEKALDGWYLTNTSGALSNLAAQPGKNYTFSPTYAGKPDDISVTLHGKWGTASYPVKFEIEPFEEDLTADPKVVNDRGATLTMAATTSDPGGSVTTGNLTWNTELGNANVPTITFSDVAGADGWTGTDKYELEGWQLYVPGIADSTLVKSGDVIANADMASQKVTRSGMVYRPVIRLKKHTITLTGGDHAVIPAIEGKSTWNVDWGTLISLPTGTETYTPSGSSTAEYVYGTGTTKLTPSENDQHAVHSTVDINTPAAWKERTTNEFWPSTNEQKLKVTTDATYDYQWTYYTYTVYFMNVGDTGNIKDLASPTEANPAMGKHTANNLQWEASVFSGKLSTAAGDADSTILDMFGQYTTDKTSNPDEKTGYVVLNPSWPGHTFNGWQQGSATAPGGGIITAPGNDIKINAAYNPDYVAANEHVVYLWASWTGVNKRVLFHKNDGKTPETEAVQTMEAEKSTKLKKVAEMGSFGRDGYTFTHWTTTSADSGTTYDDGASFIAAYDKESDLYAQWKANTYKVRFMYFDGSYVLNKDVSGVTGNVDDPYEQEFTYDVAQNLTTIDETKLNATTHNPGGDVFKGWSLNGATVGNGSSQSNMTTEQYTYTKDETTDKVTETGVVVLTPVAAGKVTLKYDANAGTEAASVSGMPANTEADNNINPVTKNTIVNSEDGPVGSAKFTLPATEPTRDGYEFDGWRIDGATDKDGNALTQPKSGDVYLPGTSTSYTAYAQWKAGTATSFQVKRFAQATADAADYTVLLQDITLAGTTGTTVTVGQGVLNHISTDYPGYTYVADATPSATIAADGRTVIELHYNLKPLTVTYAFTEDGAALTGKAAGSVPFASPTQTVTGGAEELLKLQDSSFTLPTGYEIAGGYASKWHYDATGNSMRQKVSDALSPVATGAVAADGTTKYVFVADTTLTLPIQKKAYTVTFKLGENAAWNTGEGTDDRTAANVKHYSKVKPTDASTDATTKASGELGKNYAFAGWTYLNADDASDPLNGTIVKDTRSVEIVGNTTFTANYFESFSVIWSPGTNSKSSFSHTAITAKQFTNMKAPYEWEASDPEKTAAALVLDSQDADDNGVPLAQDGYQFAGWKVVSCTDGTTDNEGNAALNKVYASLDDVYNQLKPEADYTIEAQWSKLTQTVVFDPNVTGGAAVGSESVQLQGKSGEDTLLDGITSAVAPAKPDNQPGYTFDCWLGTINGEQKRPQPGEGFTFPNNPLGSTTTTFVAQWTEDMVEISIAIQGYGTITQNKPTSSIPAHSADTYTLKANPLPGYKFVKWQREGLDISTWYDGTVTDKDNGGYGLLTLQRNSDGLYETAQYTAVFAADPYQVTFQNSATPGEGTINVTYPSGAGYFSVPYLGSLSADEIGGVSATGTNPGYTFEGWTYEVWPECNDGTTGPLLTATTPTSVATPVQTADLGTVPIMGRTVFTAQYKKNPATVTFHKNADEAEGGAFIGGKQTGDPITLPSSGFTWAGHELLGWVTVDDKGEAPTQASMTVAEFNAYEYKAGAIGDTYNVKGGDETLYAIYKAVPVTLVYDNNAVTSSYTENETTIQLATHASDPKTVYAGEAATALSVADLDWAGGTSATQPGYERATAGNLKVPGEAREFVGWSFDADADPANLGDPDAYPVVFAAGSSIPATYLPTTAGDSVTIYAIWKDKEFNVTLAAGGGRPKDGLTEDDMPATPYATGVTYGQTVPIPELMFERTNYHFLYWLANDTKNSKVSDVTGAAASYVFKGIDDVTLTARWQASADVKDEASVELRDEKDRSLSGTLVFGPYSRFDTPLYDRAYENKSVASSSGSAVSLADTSDYFTFEGWYLKNTRTSDLVVPYTASITEMAKRYTDTSLSPTGPYWSNDDNDFSATWNSNGYDKNLITLYAKKTLKAYDISFAPNIPAGSGYTEADVETMDDMQKVKVTGETRTLTANAYKLPGYRFLGWLRSGSTFTSGGVYTDSSFATARNAGNAWNDKHGLATPLLAANSTDYQITLQAAWADTANTVTFIAASKDDGVRTADEDTVYDDANATQTKKWTEAVAGVARPETHPDLVDATTDHATFVKWVTAGGYEVTPGTTTIADIVKNDTTLSPDANGNYDIELYAQWSRTSARVFYNGDADATWTGATAMRAVDAVVIPDTAGELPAAKVTPQTNAFQKAGYHADGWVGQGNDGAYNNTEGYYNRAWATAAAADDEAKAIYFDYGAKGAVVNVYPNYADNAYTVGYDYQVPTGYQSWVTPSAVPGKDASGNSIVEKSGLGYDTGSVYANGLFATPPVLEGYELSGFTYTTAAGNKVDVNVGWTVEQLIDAAVAADRASGSTDPGDEAKRYEDSTFTLVAKWSPKTFSVVYDADEGVMRATNQAPGAKANIGWLDTADSAGERLLIEESKLSKDGYSDLAWYAYKSGSELKGKANASDGGDTPTLQQLVYLYHQAKGDTQGTNAAPNANDVLSGALTLHAGWVEDQVAITFTVSDAENGYIAAANGETYAVGDVSQVTFHVGTITGDVKELPGKKITDVPVTAAAKDGYEVTGWTFDDVAISGATSAMYTPASAARYVGGTYEAQIEGKSDVPITLRYFDQAADGTYHDTPSATDSKISSDFMNKAGSPARVGDVIPAEQLGAVRTDVANYLSLDTATLADYTVKVSGNTVDLRYKRSTADVKFAWEWPEDASPSRPPLLPSARQDVRYGATVDTQFYGDGTDTTKPNDPLTTPAGYTFDGWYKGDDKLTAGSFTMDSTEDVTIVGKWKKGVYTVTIATDIYDSTGTTVVTGTDGAPVISKRDDSLTFTTTRETGQTLGDEWRIDVTDTSDAPIKEGATIGKQTGVTDLTITYNSEQTAVMWVYDNAAGKQILTSDPTAVEIDHNIEFRPVMLSARVIAYLPGEHGAFDSNRASGTRMEGVPAGFSMADYLYDGVNDGVEGLVDKVAGSLDTSGENAGLPIADEGWKFAGWAWEYANAAGYVQHGTTPASAETPEELMHAGVESLTGLVHPITLTAQWEPIESYLKLDLNDSAVVTGAGFAVRASYVSGYTSPEGLHPAYNGDPKTLVTLPSADQVSRNGFTLQKWTWTVDGATYEYAPGATFEMPGSSKKEASDPAVTLVAVWAEDYVQLNYHSNDNAKGTVSASEVVGAWSGTVRGSGAPLAGSLAQPASDTFQFVKWSKGSADGAALAAADGLGLVPGGGESSLLPQREASGVNVGRYVSTDYYATFRGTDVDVLFESADPSMGYIEIRGSRKDTLEETRTQVPYGEAPNMSALAIVAKPISTEYTTGDGRYWDVYVNTGTTASPVWTKKSQTADPSTVTVTAETKFVANFKKNEGTYIVHFDVRGGVGSFDDVKKAWGDTNVGAGKTPRRYGYEFTGWYADPYGQDPATPASKGGTVAYNAAPGLLAAVSSTYGQLAGGDAYASVAAEKGVTVKAGWRELSGFSVTFNGNGGTWGTGSSAATTQKVDNLKWTSSLGGSVGAPTRAGYDFAGWATAPSGGTSVGDDATYESLAGTNDARPGNVTLYAQWTEKLYKVKYVNYPEADAITESGDTAILRDDVKYTDVVAMGAPYNSKPDDRTWDCWRVAVSGSSNPITGGQELKGTQANWTIADFETNNVYQEDGYYVVYGTWISYITYTTHYVLFDEEVESDNYANIESAAYDPFQNSSHTKYLTKEEKGLPDDIVRPNMDAANIPPGFALNEDMTVAYGNYAVTPAPSPLYTSTDDIWAKLVMGEDGPEFYVAVVAKKNGYSVAFDLNDNNMALPGGKTLAATPDSAAGDEYPSHEVLDYYNDRNVPWNGYDLDDYTAGEPYAPPTRPGFTFGGWFNVSVPDNVDVPGDGSFGPSAGGAYIQSDPDGDTLYGDLTYDAAGNWYDPMKTSDGVLTLYANWLELQREVRYVVAEDMKGLVSIRLHEEDAGAFSTDERVEFIGVATGDKFVDGVRASSTPQGAVAKAKRGYSVQWRIVSDADGAASKTYSMPLGTGSDAPLSTASLVVQSVTDELAYVDGSSLSVQAADDDTATSGEGKLYSKTEHITPGVDTETGMFVGQSTNDADTGGANVLYVASAELNNMVSITIDPDEGSYSGDRVMSQPVGTYVGEKAPWGESDGALPAASTIVRPGYTFAGWILPAGTQYVDANGNVVTLSADTTVMPTEEYAGRILVPEGGLVLKAAWTQNPPDANVKHTVTVPETKLDDGTVIPGITLEAVDGRPLTDDQIEQVINRGGLSPDKWDITYYDPSTGEWVEKTVTTDELRSLLRSLPVQGDITIKPAAGSKARPYVKPDSGDPSRLNPGKTRPAASHLTKTGDSLNSTSIMMLASAALAAAIVLLLLSLRRKRDV